MTDPLDLLTAADGQRLRPADPPGWRAPMLATLTDRHFSDSDWLYERKLDGVRAVISRDGDEPSLWSRNRNLMNATYPELVDALAAAGPKKFVADGEIVAFDGSRTSFARLQQRIGISDAARARRVGVPVFLYLFDLLVLDGVDLSRLALRTRKRVLRAVIDFADPLRYSTHRNTEGERYLAEACRRGWEGLIAKRSGSPYRPGRSRDWLKFKCVRDQEFVVGGFTEPSGSRTGFGALLVGYFDGPALRYAGKVGTGYDRRMLTELRARLDELEQPASPFAERVREPGVHWVAPELVAQVGFTEWTGDGLLRHPRFQGLRNDKPAHEIVRETS